MKRILILAVTFIMMIAQLSYAGDEISTLYNLKQIKITKHLASGEIYLTFNLSLSSIGNSYEFQEMLQEMNIKTSGYFAEATFIMEECLGDENKMLLSCRSTNKRMQLTDNQGQKFEIIVRGKASSYLKIDRTERQCGNQVKIGTTFDLNYSGDYVTINGISIRGKDDNNRDMERENLTGKFLNSIEFFVKDNSLFNLCF